MKTIRNYLGLFNILIISITIFISSCEKTNKNETIQETTTGEAEIQSEIPALEPGVAIPSTEKLEQGKAEVKQALEQLMAQVEQKDRALTERELRLMEKEKEFAEKVEELARREAGFKRQQFVSWIVLVIGVICVILGFVIARRNKKDRKKTEDEYRDNDITIEDETD